MVRILRRQRALYLPRNRVFTHW